MDTESEPTKRRSGDSGASQAEASTDPRMIRLRKYLPHLATFEMPEGKKLEILQTLDDLVKTFVDCAFGVNLTGHPRLPVSETLPSGAAD